MKLNLDKQKDRIKVLGIPCLAYLLILIVIIFADSSFIRDVFAILAFVSIIWITNNAIYLVRYDSKKFKEKRLKKEGYFK